MKPEIIKMQDHSSEIKKGERFRFGRNWHNFLSTLNDSRIDIAKKSLLTMLNVSSLKGKTFLDAGSGSGLFSLAARLMGAKVVSFDYDPDSVACTKELKQRYFKNDRNWIINEGSVLNSSFVESLGEFDVVYSWGVLHHTGNMYQAFENIATLVAPNGLLFVSIYNDQGLISKHWLLVKRLYNRNSFYKYFLTILYAPYLFGVGIILRTATGKLALERGMSIWHDMIDWLGGYPFEVAKPNEVIAYFNKQGLELKKIQSRGKRMGCNEFVFTKK